MHPGQFQAARRWLAGFGAVALVCAGLGATTSRALTLSSTVLEDNGATVTPGHAPNQALFTGGANGLGTGVLTTAGGYDFTSTTYMTLTSITAISIRLTIQDGDSASGQSDFNHLHLLLGGNDTGFILNGFQGNGLETTLTFGGTPTNAAAILASLKANGRLVATVTTDNTNETAAMANEIFVGNDSQNATTLLTITGVPEPGTWAGVALGALGLLGLQRRCGARKS